MNLSIPKDKKLHFVGGWIIAAVVLIATPNEVYGYADHLWAIAIVAVIAAAKEGRDAMGYGTPDLMDWVFTVAGGLLAALIF